MEPIRLIRDLAPWYEAIEKACAYDPDGFINWLLICEQVKSEQWLAVEVCGKVVLIVEKLDTPKGSVLNVQICAGEAVDVVPQGLAFLEQLARDQGCSGVRVQGRKGWERWLKGRGYQHRVSILTLELN